MSRRRRSSLTRDTRTRRHQSRAHLFLLRKYPAHRRTPTRPLDHFLGGVCVFVSDGVHPAFSARNSSRSVDTPSLSPNFSPPDASPPPSRDRRALPDRCSPLARKNHTTRGRFPTPSPWRRPPRTRTTNRPSTGRALERIPRAPSTASPLTVHLFPRVSFDRPPRVATCGRPNEVLLVLSKKRRKTDDSSRDRRRVVAGGTRDSFEDSRLIPEGPPFPHRFPI